MQSRDTWWEGWSSPYVSFDVWVWITALPPQTQCDAPGRPFTSRLHSSDERVKETLDNILIQHPVRISNSHWYLELTKFCPAVWHYDALDTTQNTVSSKRLKFSKDIMPPSNKGSIHPKLPKKQSADLPSSIKSTVPLDEKHHFWAENIPNALLLSLLFLSLRCSEYHKWITSHFYCTAWPIRNNKHNEISWQPRKKKDWKCMLRSFWSFPYCAERCGYICRVAFTMFVFCGRSSNSASSTAASLGEKQHSAVTTLSEMQGVTAISGRKENLHLKHFLFVYLF